MLITAPWWQKKRTTPPNTDTNTVPPILCCDCRQPISLQNYRARQREKIKIGRFFWLQVEEFNHGRSLTSVKQGCLKPLQCKRQT